MKHKVIVLLLLFVSIIAQENFENFKDPRSKIVKNTIIRPCIAVSNVLISDLMI